MADAELTHSSFDFVSYKNDPRIACKYGSKCYQKNPLHHGKYKHPPKRKSNNDDESHLHKKAKTEETEELKIPELDKCEPENENTVTGGSNALDTREMKDDENPEVSSTTISQEKILEEDDEDMPASPEDPKDVIKQKFLVEMPDDFYSFWSFCESLENDKPKDALKDVGLQLVGPFDVLSGDLKKVKLRKQSLYLRHWRYYYDPPEFQTVLKGDDDKQFHIGYFRDDPKERPVFVASNCAALSCVISPMAGNLFGALDSYLDTFKSKCDPFRKIIVGSLKKALRSWATKESINLSNSTPEMELRDEKVVAMTFHYAGIVVPVDRETNTGYRPLLETNGNLKRMLRKYVDSQGDAERKQQLENLQPIITAANIANDECDFGTSLELGLDFFSFGGDVLHRLTRQLLCTAYSLLQRDEFAEILKSHLEDRKKGSSLSIIPQDM